MIKLETFDNLKGIIVEDTYVIYPTGGDHIFKHAKNAPQKYKEPIWPYVQRINGDKTILTAGIQNMMFYPMVSLECIEFMSNSLSKKKQKKIKKIAIHQLVARAFVTNPDPLVNIIIHHKNNDKCDFRPENLEWTTHQKNSIGVPTHLIRTPDELWKIYELINGANLSKSGIITPEQYELNLLEKSFEEDFKS